MFEIFNKHIREKKQQNPSDEQQYEKVVGLIMMDIPATIIHILVGKEGFYFRCELWTLDNGTQANNCHDDHASSKMIYRIEY